METLKAPFPWFGGKRKVAPVVWERLGDVDNYVEPFAGSLAVLLGRPTEPKTETVNDKDGYIVNFWRAVQHDPEQVAHWADWPVTEPDLVARHLWLVNEGRTVIQRLEHDPDFYDPKVAGWWVWGICAWIGGGWCSGTGGWVRGDREVVRRDDEGRETPSVNRQRIHLGDNGQGVHAPSAAAITEWMVSLSARLRRVRIASGDWSRVVTKGATNCGNTVGVFLDPPYDGSLRDGDLYRVEDHSVSADVRQWAIEHGDDQRLRICLAGYDGEHDMPKGWRAVEWKAGASYQNSTSGGKGNAENRHKERLWFSPHCLQPAQQGLFG